MDIAQDLLLHQDAHLPHHQDMDVHHLPHPQDVHHHHHQDMDAHHLLLHQDMDALLLLHHQDAHHRHHQDIAIIIEGGNLLVGKIESSFNSTMKNSNNHFLF